jgi:hypothetical protein
LPHHYYGGGGVSAIQWWGMFVLPNQTSFGKLVLLGGVGDDVTLWRDTANIVPNKYKIILSTS